MESKANAELVWAILAKRIKIKGSGRQDHQIRNLQKITMPFEGIKTKKTGLNDFALSRCVNHGTTAGRLRDNYRMTAGRLRDDYNMTAGRSEKHAIGGWAVSPL